MLDVRIELNREGRTTAAPARTEDRGALGRLAKAAPDGDWPAVFAVKNTSDNVRRKSSSGGVFHALASHIIEDIGGVVYGCAFDSKLRAGHIRCKSVPEVERCMGSKYTQSDMGGTIRSVRRDLEAGETVLFTGTPCQVAAVKTSCAKARKDGLLLTADIICHGVPSPKVFQGWLLALEHSRGKSVLGYEHRPKTMGWGHHERVTYEDGSSEQATRWADAWMRHFYDNRDLRPSCYRCPYTTTKRSSDITIADFWGIERTGHAGFADDLGVSLVLANTPAGMGLLARLDVMAVRSSLSDAVPRNPMLERPSFFKGNRARVWEEIYDVGVEGMMRREGFLASPLRRSVAKVKSWVKRALGR